VHALETIHTALRPQGLLLDMRPEPQNPWIEIQRADGMARLGQLNDTYRMGTLAIADAAVQTVIDAGRFVRERETTFPFVYHCSTVDTWLAYMAADWSSATVDAELIVRARELLPDVAGDGSELRIVRAIHAARLRRL
jgi:hypothetical protein